MLNSLFIPGLDLLFIICYNLNGLPNSNSLLKMIVPVLTGEIDLLLLLCCLSGFHMSVNVD